MSDELRPCPYCGTEQDKDDIEDNNIRYTDDMSRECDWCGATVHNGWNTRPLEDALQAKLDEVIVFLKWMMAQDEIFDVDKYITDMLKRLEG